MNSHGASSTELPARVQVRRRQEKRLPGKVRVLLVNSNRYDQPYPVYPVGLGYLCGALKSAGHLPQVWDAQFSDISLEDSIAAFKPEVVGVSMRNVDNVQYHNPQSFVQDVVDCCTRIRAATDAVLLLGGSGFSIFPEALCELVDVDYGIQGAGEEPILQLIECLQTGKAPDGIPGLFCQTADGTVRSTPPGCDAVDFCVEPRHEPGLLQRYSSAGSLPGIQTQRGCPLHCCYCTYPLIEGRRSRFRPTEQIVEELRGMVEAGVHYVFIVDSVFNTRPGHVKEICEALIEAKLDLQWECFLRPAGVTRELLELMKRAGLRHVEFGSDSFSDPVLAKYGKGFTFADIREASEHAHALGIHCGHFLIFGGPGETKDTVEETLARAQTLPGAYYFATIGMRIYPGTPLWRDRPSAQSEQTAAEFLQQPHFYLAPGFTVEGLLTRLLEQRKMSPNWVIGDPPPAFLETIKKLYARGLRGPLWEYIELLQRLDPQVAAGAGSGAAGRG